MKIARWLRDGRREDGILDDDTVVAFADGTSAADVLAGGLERALETGERTRSRGRSRSDLNDVELIAPLDPPAVRDFAVFAQHVEGMVRGNTGDPSAPVPEAWYEEPVFYFTNPHSIIGDGSTVVPPAGTERLDFELELAVVIGGVPGRRATDLTVKDAAEHIFGYTVMNDWSARDVQAREMRLGLGPSKGKDFATTLGPCIVTHDTLLPHLDADGFLGIRGSVAVNDEVIGTDTFAHMAWTFPEMIAFASRASRVAPGDVLGSGTTGSGCLAELWGRSGRLDPPPLQPGDVVTLTIDGVGSVSNVVGHPHPATPIPPGRRRSTR